MAPRVSAIPNVGHSQTNSNGPAGGSGHVHHQDIKEYRGGVVEYFRTLAARDAWHAGQGYRAGRDMRLIVLHKDHGEVERHRCDVAMLAAA